VILDSNSMTALEPTRGSSSPPAGGPVLSFVQVRLTKHETFDACQALADADRVLVATGNIAEARALGDLFELLEHRMSHP
jgi:hypothetical protein